MKLQTKIKLNKQVYNLIDYNSKVLLLGSCFSENIGAQFNYFKFQHYINPFGILFHPKAIETLVDNALNEKKYTDDDVFFNNEQFHCYNAHSKLSNASKSQLLFQLNAASQKTNHYLKQASHIVLTLGTAWVYRLIATNQIVANCHKVSQNSFQKELLSVQRVEAALQSIISKIRKVNPEVIFVFTVSPVRHIKDGFVENTQSKSHLITAIHNSCSKDKADSYFPSYEIMLDELRDYRFYKQDMLHPNETAIQYIWGRFKSVWITEASEKIMKEVDVIQKGLTHRPFNENSEAHQKFLVQLKKRQDKLTLAYPFVMFK